MLNRTPRHIYKIDLDKFLLANYRIETCFKVFLSNAGKCLSKVQANCCSLFNDKLYMNLPKHPGEIKDFGFVKDGGKRSDFKNSV